MKEVKVALIQMNVVCGAVAENMANAARMLDSVDKPYDIAVFPECIDYGWANPASVAAAQPIPNAVTEYLCAMAKEKNIHIVAGITEKENEKLYNASLLIDSNGKIIGKHRKINILTEVEYIYSVGESISVFDTVFGKIGIPICADNLINSTVIAESMARMGCDFILSPCSWAVNEQFSLTKATYGAEWIEPYTKIASIYKIPVVGVSNVGKVTCGAWEGHRCIGNSIAVTADCDVITLPFGETAECSRVVNLKIYNRPALGTALSDLIGVKKFTKSSYETP